jgi:hypothetical protein
MNDSITLRASLDRRAGRDPIFAAELRAVRDRFGESWDPLSVLARRFRAVRYAEWLLDYEHDGGTLAGGYETGRSSLAQHCDPAFAGLPLERAAEWMRPRRGPAGAAGVIARWATEVGAFGATDTTLEAKRFRQAVRDVSPARRRRSRAK